MKRFVALATVIVALSWDNLAYAQNDAIHGVWRQIKSNAGLCRTCQLSVEARDGASLVTANNGWSANVRPEPRETRISSGEGSWRPGGTGPHSGKPFRIHFANTGARLYMIMLGQGFRVEAEFERRLSDTL